MSNGEGTADSAPARTWRDSTPVPDGGLFLRGGVFTVKLKLGEHPDIWAPRQFDVAHYDPRVTVVEDSDYDGVPRVDVMGIYLVKLWIPKELLDAV